MVSVHGWWFEVEELDRLKAINQLAMKLVWYSKSGCEPLHTLVNFTWGAGLPFSAPALHAVFILIPDITQKGVTCPRASRRLFDEQ